MAQKCLDIFGARLTRPQIRFWGVLLVVGEQGGHEVEEVVVVFAPEDSLDGDLHDFGFERWQEFALDFPIL